MVQVYVPGNRLFKILGVPSGRGVALASPVHWMVAVVTPRPARDWKLTVIFESGVSLKASPSSFPVPQVVLVPTVTL